MFKKIAMLSLLLTGCQLNNDFLPFYSIIPDSVTDSGIFKVVTGNNKEKQIILCGLNNIDQQYLKTLLNKGDQMINLNIVKETNKEILAEVFIPISEEEEIAVNGELLLAGKAKYNGDNQCDNSSLYQGFEQQAKEQKLGLWQ